MKLRLADLIDILSALEQAAFASGPSPPYTQAILRDLLADSSYRILLACSDRIVGIPTPVPPEGPSPCEKPTGHLIARRSPLDGLEELHHVGVPTELRRKGVGRQLLRAWIDAARPVSNRLLLEVSEQNESAWRLYMSLGFAQIGIRRRYYPDGSSARIYELRLF